jgi:hypothetical protein
MLYEDSTPRERTPLSGDSTLSECKPYHSANLLLDGVGASWHAARVLIVVAKFLNGKLSTNKVSEDQETLVVVVLQQIDQICNYTTLEKEKEKSRERHRDKETSQRVSSLWAVNSDEQNVGGCAHPL